MEVILIEEVSSLGSAGDVVKVAPGYARNFLIPRHLAVGVNRQNQKMVEHRLAAIASKRKEALDEANETSAKLKKVNLVFMLKSGEGGKSFGSITVKDIADKLSAEGFSIDRRRLRLDVQVKTPGSYSAVVRLHTELSTDLPFEVKAEERKEEVVDSSEDRKPRRGGRGRKPRADGATQTDADAKA